MQCLLQPCVRVADLAATILVGTASSSALQCSCSCAAGLPATQGRNISKCHPPWRNGRSIEAAGAACQQHGLGWVPLSSFSGPTLAVHFLTHAMDPPHATISPSSTTCHTKHKYPCQALQHTAPTNDAQVPAGLGTSSLLNPWPGLSYTTTSWSLASSCVYSGVCNACCTHG